MTPEEPAPSTHSARALEMPRSPAAGGHDTVILQAAERAARRIRLERRNRYARLGLRTMLVVAVLALALAAQGAHLIR